MNDKIVVVYRYHFLCPYGISRTDAFYIKAGECISGFYFDGLNGENVVCVCVCVVQPQYNILEYIIGNIYSEYTLLLYHYY